MVQKKGAPNPRDPQEEAAAAALQVFRAEQLPTVDELVQNDFSRRYLRATQYEAGGWMHGPAHLEIFSATVDWLQQNGAQRGIEGQVSKVRAAKYKLKKEIYIYATDHDDPQGIEVTYARSGAWINLISLLGPAKLTERAGYRSRYNIEWAGEDSPVGPALVLDLGRRQERRRNWKPTKGKKTDSKGSVTEGETKA